MLCSFDRPARRGTGAAVFVAAHLLLHVHSFPEIGCQH